MRFLLALILAGGVMWQAPVFAQYNPSAPVVPSLPPPPTPPAATPGMNPQPAPVGRDSSTNPLKPERSLRTGDPSAETHNDRAIRCTHQGGALGVPSGQMGQYVQECVNGR